MARINAKQGNQLVLQLGTISGNSVTYASTVLVNTNRTIKFEADAEVAALIDTADMTAPAVPVSYISSTGWSFDGSGVTDYPSSNAVMDWFKTGQPKPVKVVGPSYTITGNAVCMSYSESGERLSHIESELSIVGSGDWTRT